MTKIVDYKPVTPSPGQPIWAAVRDSVREVIDSGQVGPGDRIPSTKALSETMSVSLVTVHRALQDLVAAGVLRRGQGRGTFVHEAYLSPDRKTSDVRLGLVVHAEASLANPYYSPIMDGIRRAAHAEGADLVFLRYGEDWRNECDGFIYVNPSQEQIATPPRFGAANSKSRAGDPPLMQIGASFEADGFGWVDADNTEIGRRAVIELHRAGHTRIGLVGELPKLSNSLDRERGFKQAAAELGVLRSDRDCVRSDGWRLDQAGKQRLRELLTSDDRPTALFASGYYFALDIYDTARDLGLSIPGDIAVLGVDDPPSATHLAPALSTFRQPLEEMGELVVAEHLKALRGESAAPARRTLDASFIPRASHLGAS